MRKIANMMIAVSLMTGSSFAALVMHLDADTLVLSDGASVATWTDQTANANHATQATGTAQPTYVASNAAFNNRATVSFDGTSDYMYLNNSMVTVNSFTLFLVGNFDVTGVEQYMISAQGGAGNDRLRVATYGWGTGDAVRVRIGSTGDTSAGYGVVGTDTFAIAVTGTADAWLNLGAKQTVGNNTSSDATSDLILGAYYDSGDFARNFLSGDLAEVRLYDTILTDTEIQTINGQLATTYAIPEPATLGLIGAFGAGLLFVRRRFMI